MLQRRGIVYLILLLAFLPAGPALAERHAFVIGNGDYERSPDLRNPANDAEALAARLGSMGFQLWGGGPQLNLTRLEMIEQVRGFANSLEPGDVAVFYFAGHGIQYAGQNYLIPSDDDGIGFRDDLPEFAFAAEALMRRLRGREGVTSVLIFDACRNNPLPARNADRNVAQGLAHMEAPEGSPTYIVFSTAKGQTAADGAGENSPFALALLRALEEGQSRIEDVMYSVRAEVRVLSNGAQVPWSNSSLEAPLFLSDDRGGVPASRPTQVRSAADAMSIAWASIDLIADPFEKAEAYRAYEERYPESPFVPLIGGRVAALEASIEQPQGETNWDPEGEPYFGTVDLAYGFLPDPFGAELQAGGLVDARRLGRACNGWIGNRPDFVLNYEAGDAPLFLSAMSAADTILVVQTPDGEWLCNDDYDLLNPMVTIGEPASGSYRVWVGVYGQQGSLQDATVGISEIGYSFQ